MKKIANANVSVLGKINVTEFMHLLASQLLCILSLQIDFYALTLSPFPKGADFKITKEQTGNFMKRLFRFSARGA
jgi:hypothetical protein